jgi:membrane protease YdiL (CAAX protease family)
MSSTPANNSVTFGAEALAAERSAQIEKERGRRDLFELAVGYGLIMTAIWTPLPWQRWVDWIALAWVLAVTAISFDGWSAMGLRERGFLRSLWVVGAALVLALAAAFLGGWLGTLHAPRYPMPFVQRYWAYAVWAFLQEFLILDYFLLRLLRLLRSKTAAIATTTALFALAHVPNPILVPLALLWGVIACALFLRYRNLYTLGMAHAILGICVAVTVPGQVDHNMRVGIGYLTYRQHHQRRHHLNQIPQTVSTTLWVMAEAPTRRS